MKQELRDFGLSDNEIETYLALLRTSTTTANRLYEITGIKRSTTYDVLKSLITKGLVSNFIKSGTHYFEPIDPQKILTLLDEKQRKMSSILPDLKKIYYHPTTKTSVQFFEGKQGVIICLQDLLASCKEFLFLGSRKQAMIALSQYPENVQAKRVRSGIHVQALCADEDRNDPFYQRADAKRYTTVRFLSSLNGVQTNSFIYNDKVLIMTSVEPFVSVLISSPEIVAQQKTLFEQLWSIAKK